MKLLRGIKKAKWAESAQITTKDTDILNLLPDPIGDLATSKSTISVWDIGQNEARLDKIVKELAGRRQKPQPFEFAVFSSDILDNLGILTENIHDNQTKELGKYHHNINIPSSEKLLELAKSLILDAKRDWKTKIEIAKIP